MRVWFPIEVYTYVVRTVMISKRQLVVSSWSPHQVCVHLMEVCAIVRVCVSNTLLFHQLHEHRQHKSVSAHYTSAMHGLQCCICL